MKVGIRYCGGCNPRYDRASEVRRLMDRCPAATFTFDGSECCDLWILVCGCPAACVSDEGLRGKEIIRLSQRKDFARVRERIAEIMTNVSSVQAGDGQTNLSGTEKQRLSGKRALALGESASLQKTFTMDEVKAFAALSLDANPLHLDPDYAKKGIFRRPVVHGVLAAGLLSSVMGSKLPGPGTVLMEEKVHFLHPVYPGECISAEITFESYEETRNYYIGHFSGRCTNEEGVTVIEGSFRQMMRKRVFEIEEAGGKDDKS